MDDNSVSLEKEYARITLSNFGQLLYTAMATDESIHRVRLRKLQEFSGITKPNSIDDSK